MKKLYSALAMFGMVLSASAATAPPKVVFIGDYFTYNWTSGFAANPNWINKGVNGNLFDGQSSSDALARFQSDVVALHPAIVHIMIGAIDSEMTYESLVPFTPPGFEQDLDAMVKQAKAANIKVILGISPPTESGPDLVNPQIAAIIAGYGAQNNIEVVNYADALCQCVGALAEPSQPSPNGLTQMTTSIPSAPPSSTLIPTATGYAVMTAMAQTAIANTYLTLETGWLSNVTVPDGNGPASNVNQATPGEAIVFTPIGYYSDGSTHPQNSTAWSGNNGTWTSSNPVVASVNEQGVVLALTPGTTIIRYTSATGQKFSEWIMYVGAGED